MAGLPHLTDHQITHRDSLSVPLPAESKFTHPLDESDRRFSYTVIDNRVRHWRRNVDADTAIDRAAPESVALAYQQATRYGQDLKLLYQAEKAKAQELNGALHLLDAIFDSIPDGIVVLDDELIVQQANQAFASLTLKAPEALVGWPLREVLLADKLLPTLQAMLGQDAAPAAQELNIVQPVQDEGQEATVVFKKRSFLMRVARLQQDQLSGWVVVLQEQTERKQLEDAFGRYVGPDVVERVLEQRERPSDTMVVGSVLFADIRAFTALAEQLTSAEVVGLLNRYFATVEPIINENGGWIAKFAGDSLMAVFGVPDFEPDHALRAARAAWGIRSALAEFNLEQRLLHGPELRIGIGVACGEMVAGSVGSHEHMEYTVIGDTVNVAARLEALTKRLGVDILISDPVYQSVRSEVEAEAMPLLSIRGKSMPVQTYALRWMGKPGA